MGARAGGQEPGHAEPSGVDLPEPAARLVGHVEQPAVGRELHVLRTRSVSERQRPDDLLPVQVDHDHLRGELAAGEEHVTPSREIHVVDAEAGGHGQRTAQGHRARLTEVEAPQALGDHDRRAPVRREVQVVGVHHPDRRAARASRGRVDRGQGVPALAVDVERVQVVRGRHVLRHSAHLEVTDDPKPSGVDDVECDNLVGVIIIMHQGIDIFGTCGQRE